MSVTRKPVNTKDVKNLISRLVSALLFPYFNNSYKYTDAHMPLVYALLYVLIILQNKLSSIAHLSRVKEITMYFLFNLAPGLLNLSFGNHSTIRYINKTPEYHYLLFAVDTKSFIIPLRR